MTHHHDGHHHQDAKMHAVTILDNRPEADNIFTLDIDWQPRGKPLGGQFVMIWIPGIDEIPMSISSANLPISMSIQVVGEASRALDKMGPGDKLGIKGPFGNGFKLTGQNILFIAGGIGIAPLMPAIEEAVAGEKKVTVAIGAASAGSIAFQKKLADMNIDTHIATDDGTKGHKGFVTTLVEELLAGGNYDQILTCGPEIMMSKLVELANSNNIPIQCSLERYMKCGMGICGSCDIDGLQVCKDGPVFDGQVLAGLEDFGKSKRDKSGKKVGF